MLGGIFLKQLRANIVAGTILGLDMGPNSIGWALINEQDEAIVDLGVRIFPEGVENFDTSKEKSRSENRRLARGARRQTTRRGRRKRELRDALITAELFPTDLKEQERLYTTNPYELRTRALDEELRPHEIGRVLLHLNQRRGFLSNRRMDRSDSEAEGMLAEMSELAQQIEASGSRTLGEYLYRKHDHFDHAQRSDDDHVRRRHTRRVMLETEFDAIWESQSKFHSNLLTPELCFGQIGRQDYPVKPRPCPKGLSLLEAFGIHGMIFFQRPMYWPKSVIGLCELEPKQKRCPKADRHFQRCRLLQEVNNLRLADNSARIERKLTDEERLLLLDNLLRKKELKFDKMRELLGQLPDNPAPEQIHFTLERGKRTKMQGMPVDALMAGKKINGAAWHKRPEEEKDTIIRLLIDNERDDDVLAERLTNEFGFTPAQADEALKADFPDGYGNLSLLAIDKLLPHLERGLIYQGKSDQEESALHAAGYLRRDELKRRLFDRLPNPARMNPRNCPLGEIPNPVVRRALVELRKLVNAIIREYGKPDAVHVEMARSIQMGQDARRKYNTFTREREKQRDHAADEIRKIKSTFPAQASLRVNRDSILRYLLWQEQKTDCIYCGKKISQQQLFGGDTDIDHILPRYRSLDDSQSNKVICHRRCNHDKSDKTPYEWLASTDPQRYEQICQRASALVRQRLMPYGKYRKFLQRNLNLDDFVARQLNDTAYISKVTAEYLRCLFEKDHFVLGIKGQQTATLRWQWGLNTILRDDGEDRKSRDDHRHHAVDALVVALTNRSRLHSLAEIRKTDGFDHETGEVFTLPRPWDNFRKDVEQRVANINVSHRVQRNVAGGLHDEMPFGTTDKPGVFVKRKPIIDLSANEIEKKIRDGGIKKTILDHLKSKGIEIENGKKPTAKHLKEALADVRMPSGVPIKKVRLRVPNETVTPIREEKAEDLESPTVIAHVCPGDNHHACIFEWEEKGKPKRDAEYVSRLEASRRIRRDVRESLVRRQHSKRPEARFLMSLSPGDSVLAEIDGTERLMIVSTLVSTQKRIHLVDSRDARRSGAKKDLGTTPNSLIAKYKARKVTVDLLGRIRWAND